MKKLFALIIIALLCLTVTGVYYFSENMAPKAEPVIIPEEENIISAFIGDKDNSFICSDFSDYEYILEKIMSSQPTRKNSMNDYPVADEYYILDLETKEQNYRYYIYREKSRFYIESPYVGIYETDEEFFEKIKNCLQ